jgi:peptidoglycan/xylan/chitin deacetylase (PgdA/CDA1 family)
MSKTQTSHYNYEPIVQRAPVQMPEGAQIAVVPFINIEHFPENVAGTALVPGTTGFTPDPLNYGWRDYGNRVGLWRIASALEEVGAPASICLNADIVDEYPQIIEEGLKRGWCWMGHSINNTKDGFLSGLDEDSERKLISGTLQRIQDATGERVKGWLGPFLTETFNTPHILAELGVEYLCDFSADDQPFVFNTRTGSLISVPYTLEINDVPAILNIGLSAEQFGDMIIDQFDVLYEEGRTNPRVMPIALHPFVAGQAFRSKHLRRALAHIASHDNVWFASSDQINDWFRGSYLNK